MQNANCYKKVLVHNGSFLVPLLTKSKLTVFFGIVSILYLLLYTWSSLTCVCMPCSNRNVPRRVLCPRITASRHPAVSATKNPRKIDPYKESFIETGSPQYDLRHVEFATSNEELEFLLNIRKLMLFAVYKLNQSLKHTFCVRWWANPLDLISYTEISKSDNHTNHRIKFIIQPGNIIHLQVEIRQNHVNIHNINGTELEIIGPFELLNAPSAIFGACKEDANVFTETMNKTCICVLREEIVELETATEAAKKMWKLMDPELETWKPNYSFMIGDYMNFTDFEWFLKSPGNTTNEVRDRKFSSEYCSTNLKMLVMISSAPMHFKHRKVIRETFASPDNLKGKAIKVVFLMGIPTNESVNAEVLTEEEKFRDIIIANFEDSYHNLTLSHLSMYKWMQLTCGNGQNQEVTLPKFLLKADDDFLLNLDLALKVAEANPDIELIGCLFCGTPVVRDTEKQFYYSKYYTPRYMHISGSYAGYFNGVAYLLRTDVIPLLLHMSITTPFIHMDDAYVTGILTRQFKIHPRNSQLFTSRRIEPDSCNTKTVVNSQVNNPEDMMQQWNQLSKPTPTNCTLSNLPIKVDYLDKATKRKCFYE